MSDPFKRRAHRIVIVKQASHDEAKTSWYNLLNDDEWQYQQPPTVEYTPKIMGEWWYNILEMTNG